MIHVFRNDQLMIYISFENSVESIFNLFLIYMINLFSFIFIFMINIS